MTAINSSSRLELNKPERPEPRLGYVLGLGRMRLRLGLGRIRLRLGLGRMRLRSGLLERLKLELRNELDFGRPKLELGGYELGFE